MTKITAWEKLPKRNAVPDGTYFMRIGSTCLGIGTYEFGYMVGKLVPTKVGHRLTDSSYVSDLVGVQRVINSSTTRLHGELCKGIEEAVEAAVVTKQLCTKLEGFIDAE